MDWWEWSITVSAEDVDAAAAVATMAAPLGFSIEDYSDLEQGAWEIAHSDLIDEELCRRDKTRAVLHLYVSPEGNPAEIRAFLEQRLQAAGISFTLAAAAVSEEDWANNWKAFFKPLPVGRHLLICPTWEPCPEAPERRVLTIDPGMAFGTGGHETTRLVLEALEETVTPETALLDVGCGSGILSIAALLLGAQRAVGVDIDPLAVKTALENGKRNGFVPPQLTVTEGNLVDRVRGTFDVVVANIVADAIIALSGDISAFLRPGGIYIVSGIIDTREADVLPALERDGFRVVRRLQQNGWLCYICAAAPRGRRQHETT